MALTLNSNPSNYQSFHDDLWFVVTSNNIAQPNFKYVFDVYINSVLVSRIKSYPQPTSSVGIFNAASIVRNYWSSYFLPPVTPNSLGYIGHGNEVSYNVKLGEEYNGSLYTNLLSYNLTALNYYPSTLIGGMAYDGNWYETYWLSNVLSTRDSTKFTTTLFDNRLFLTLQDVDLSAQTDWRLVITRNNSGTLTTIVGQFEPIDGIAVLDISPTAINNYLAGPLFITAATQSYEVQVEGDIPGTAYVANVSILCDYRYKNIPLHFLNSLGGYDTMNFNLVNRESRNAEKKSYEEIEWKYGSGNMRRANANNVFNGGTKQFYTAQTINYKLTSDWLNHVDYNWLRDLIMSPEVYMEYKSIYSGYAYFIPVTISTSNWSEKKRYADKTYNLELEIQLGTKEFSQFR